MDQAMIPDPARAEVERVARELLTRLARINCCNVDELWPPVLDEMALKVAIDALLTREREARRLEQESIVCAFERIEAGHACLTLPTSGAIRVCEVCRAILDTANAIRVRTKEAGNV